MASKNNQSEKVMSPSVVVTMIVCGIALVAVVVLALVMKSGSYIRQQVALTVGDEPVSAVEYGYFYTNTANSYMNDINNYYYLYLMGYDFNLPPARQTTNAGDQTWLEYFTDLASDSVVQNTVLYLEGKEAGFTVDQDECDKYVEEYIQAVKDAAKSYNFSFKEYLEAAFCDGMDEATLRQCVAKAYYAAEYYTSVVDAIEVSDAEAEEYKNENLATYTTADVRVNYYTFDLSDNTSKAEALAKAQQHVAEGTTAELFEEVAHKMLDASEQEEKADLDLTLSSEAAVNGFGSEIQKWLLSEERVEGDVAYFEESNRYAVVYYISTDLIDYNLKTVRHILIPFETNTDDPDTEEDESELTDAQKADARAKIDAIYDEYLAGEKTEDAFAALATEKSEDSSAADGGLIPDMTKGAYVEAFENWAFDESRQVGDVEVIETEYGYHLMYFVETGDAYWKESAVGQLTAEKYNDWYDETKEAYVVTYDEEAIDKVVY